MALTRITKGVIKPNENYDTHDINSTGIITATGANITGNLSVGGVLTYEDVSSIDSVGIITANQGIHVGAGISAVGIITAASFRGDGSQLSGVGIDTSQLDVNKLDVTGIATFKGGLNLIAPTGDYPSITAIDGNDKLTLRSNGLLVNNQNGFRGLEYTGSSIHLYSGQMASHTLVLQTDAKGVKVGTGVTLETNGQATFSGIVTATSFSGSGANLTSVNADTVDGIQAASFVRSDAIDDVTGTLTLNNNLLKFSGTSNDRTLIHFIKSNEIKWRLLQNSYNAGGGDNLNFDRVNGTGIFMVDGYRVLTTSDINAQASGAVHSGISTFQDIDVDGHTNLDNASIAGVVTATTFKSSSVDIDGGSIDNTNIGFNLRAHGLFNNVEASGYVRSTGHIKVADHIEHDGDSDTLIKFPAANTISFETGGYERFRITSDGRFGFNTNNPDTNFRMDLAGSLRVGTGSYGSRIQFSRSGLGDELVIGVDGYGNSNANDAMIQSSINSPRPLLFGTNNAERLRIDSNGRIGINSTTPRTYLQVSKGSSHYNPGNPTAFNSNNVLACFENNDDVEVTLLSPNNKKNIINFGDTDNVANSSIEYDHSINHLLFKVNGGSERFRINNSGAFGLAGTNYGTAGQVLTSGGTNGVPTWTTVSGTTINNNADNRVITGSGTANTLEAESTLTYNAGSLVVNGKNSINTTSIITYSPGGDVRWQMGVNNSTGADLTSKNTSGSYNTYQINAGTFKVRTTGTNTPVERFTIDGNGKTSISVNKDSTALVIDGTSSGTYFGETGGRIEFLMNNEVNQFTGNFAARIAPYLDRSNNGFGLKFDVRYNASTTYKALDITSDYEVLPGSDNTISLGNSSYRWSNIYSADLQLSNIGTGGNEVDGTEGSWTLQEAEDTVYMINRINGKRYKIKMEEV